MPNSLVDLYRKNLASQGLTDSRDDLLITQELGQQAQQSNPELFDQYPDFGQEYGAIRDANAPSLPAEFGRALKGGSEELGATVLGAGAAVTDSDLLKRGARSLQENAAENAPTVGSMEDIAPGKTGIRKALSFDTLRYITSKAGSAIPSLAEMAGTAAAGAAVGSAIEPGAGTLAGAGEGVVESFLGRGIIKSAIKRLVQSGVAGDLTETGVADAIRAGDQKLADLVTQQAKTLAARRTGEAVNLANIYGTTAGGIYNETGRRDLAAGVGALGTLPFAIPGASLAGQIAKRLFPDLAPAAAQEAAAKLVGDKTSQVLARLGRAGAATAAGTGSVLAMEASNIVANNLATGKEALDLSDADWKRLREAAVAGVIGAAPFAAGAAMEPGRAIAPGPGAPAAEVAPGPATPTEASVPVETRTAPAATDLVRNVISMTDEEKQARLAELSSQPARSPQEEQQYQVLKATVKVAPVQSEALPPETVAPTEPVAVPQEEAAPAVTPDGPPATPEAAETVEPPAAVIPPEPAGVSVARPAETPPIPEEELPVQTIGKRRRISVGSHPIAGDDILNEIEQRGGIRPKSAAKNPGGEYDDLASTFTGVARLLLRKSGTAPDQMAQELHADGIIQEGDVGTMNSAVDAAIRSRQAARRQVGKEEIGNRFDAAFLGNERGRKWLMANKPISVDDLNTGNTFTVNGEKFTVKNVDENGNVTIEDGVSRTVPAGTPVFPDKGKVRRSRVSKDFLPPDALTPAPAPATFVVTQDFGAAGKVDLYNLTADIPGHAAGSTVSRETLERAGFEVPTALTYRDVGFDSADKFLAAYEKGGVHDAFETADEFMRRIFCAGQ